MNEFFSDRRYMPESRSHREASTMPTKTSTPSAVAKSASVKVRNQFSFLHINSIYFCSNYLMFKEFLFHALHMYLCTPYSNYRERIQHPNRLQRLSKLTEHQQLGAHQDLDLLPRK